MKSCIVSGVLALACVIVLVNSATIPPSNEDDGRTIDEVLMDAMTSNNNLEMLDLFHDLGDGKMMAMVELDILLNMTELAAYNQYTNRQKRKAWSNLRLRWPNREVPYEIQRRDFTASDINTIRRGINQWEQHTCLKFREVQPSETRSFPSRILFRDGEGCYSRLGRTGTVQPISLGRGCRTNGIVVHEVGHAIGWIHEQARPDRDEFITVNFAQIPPNWRSQYAKTSARNINDYGVDYDYTSIMHYSANSFGPRTIVTKDPAFQNRIGQRTGLSFKDIKLANLMYECSRAGTTRCSTAACPGEGFRREDCQCYCPGPNLRNPVVRCSSMPQPATTPRPITTVTTTAATTTTPSGVTPPQECRDLLRQEACESLKQSGQCSSDHDRLMIYCKKTCEFCDEDPNKMCMDFDNACPFIATSGYCNETHAFSDLIRSTCPKSCKVCTPTAVPCGADFANSSSTKTDTNHFCLILLVTMVIFKTFKQN